MQKFQQSGTMDPRMAMMMMFDPLTRLRMTMLEDGTFEKLDNDEDRARFMIDNLTLYDFDCWDAEEKSAQQSARLRETGNRSFTDAGKLKATFELYCQAVLYAPPGSAELSLAYGNRSAVLFKARFYAESLVDIERALKIGYPEHLKAKLLIRKVKCIYALTGDRSPEVTEALAEAQRLVAQLDVDDKNWQMVDKLVNDPQELGSVDKSVRRMSTPTYVPKLAAENPKMPGASSAITLRYSRKYGRHMVTTRDVEPGELLVVQKPYVTMISPKAMYELCDHCTKQTLTGIPCDHCVHMMYCSEECKTAAWEKYHDVECAALAKAIATKLQTHSLIGLRITILALKQAGSFEALEERVRTLEAKRGQENDPDYVFDPESYDMVYMMDSNSDKKTLFELLHWASNATIVTYFLATRTRFFGKIYRRDITLMKKVKWFTLIAGLTGRNMKIAKTQAFEEFDESKEDRPSMMYSFVPVFCFFNHNCYTLATGHHFNQFMTVMTPSPLKKGEQVFVCYGNNFLGESKQERQEFLLKEFHFTCNCLACENDWTSSTCISYRKQGLPRRIVERLDANAKTFLRIMQDVPKTDEGLLKAFADIRKAIKEYSQYVRLPCSELMQVLKLINMVHRLLGNQYVSLDE